MGAASTCVAGCSAAMRTCNAVFLALVAVLAVTVVTSNETTAKEDFKGMSREQLVAALESSRSDVEAGKKELKHAHDKITTLTDELDAVTDDEEYEHNRRANEKDTKKKEQMKAQKKKNKKLKKETKFSDLMMEHAAKYLSFKVAEHTKDKGSKIQKALVLEAARQAGRAGAVQPLKKVMRSAAVAAVKKARLAAKKAGTKGKHALRKISVKAAKDAVTKLIAEQDALVEKTAQKVYKLALKKYPPSVFLAEDDDKPNNFVAPPSIHLGFDAPDTSEVEEVEEPEEKEEEPKKAAPKKATKKAAPKKAAEVDAVVPEFYSAWKKH